MCQGRFICHKKCPVLLGDAGSGGCEYMKKGFMGVLCTSAQCCCEPKTVLEHKVYLKNLNDYLIFY